MSFATLAVVAAVAPLGLGLVAETRLELEVALSELHTGALI